LESAFSSLLSPHICSLIKREAKLRHYEKAGNGAEWGINKGKEGSRASPFPYLSALRPELDHPVVGHLSVVRTYCGLLLDVAPESHEGQLVQLEAA